MAYMHTNLRLIWLGYGYIYCTFGSSGTILAYFSLILFLSHFNVTVLLFLP